MGKQPVKRQRAMFAGVGGGNSVEAKAVHKLRQAEIDEVSARGNRAHPPKLVENSPLDEKPKPDWPAKLKAVGMSITEFADLTGTPISTAYDWSRGHTPTPGWVWAMVWLLVSKDTSAANLKLLRASPKQPW